MYYIGVDCTGIKTTMILADNSKELINSIIIGPVCYSTMGMASVIKTIEIGLTQLLCEKDIRTADCYAAFSVDYAEHNSALDIQFERLLSCKFAGFSLVNDSVAAFNAVFKDESGIAVIAGTGSIAYGQDDFGNIARCGGYGTFASDEGSGYWLGHEAIRLFYNQCDGRMAAGPLHKAMCQHFQIGDEYGMINLVERRFSEDKYAVEQIQSVLALAAANGDAAALRAYKKAAHKLADLAVGVRKQLGFSFDVPMRVSYAGSVFASGELILEPFKRALHDLNFELIAPNSTMLAQGAINIAFKLNN